MLKRILASLFMLPLLIVLYFGGLPLYICELIFICVAIHEFYNVFENIDMKPVYWLGYAFALCIFAKNIMKLNPAVLGAVYLMVFFVGALYMLACKRNILEVSVTLMGAIYVGVFFDSIIMTYDLVTGGNIIVWYIFLIAFGTDIFAYFTGMAIGKHKLIPKVSPKKTIEGAIGGIIGSIVLCVLFAHFFDSINWYDAVAFGFIGSIVSQIGDLFASSVKRYAGVKDYGKIIPGHGGILDRFDSVIMVAPFVLMYSMFFI